MAVVYCDKDPIHIRITSWLSEHQGRISVGHELEEKNSMNILAYSDDIADAKILRQYAKKENALVLKSIDNGGITAIE